MDGLRLAARRAGGRVTVRVAGDLDIATKPELAAYLTSTLRDGDQRVSLDLAGVTFIDAGGLGVLVGFRNRIRQQDIELVLVDSAACVLRLLKITGLDQEFALT